MNRPDLDAIETQAYTPPLSVSPKTWYADRLAELIDYARTLEQHVRHLEMNLVVHVEMEHDAHAERIAELEAALEPFASAFHLNGIESIRWSPTLLHFKDAAQVLNK